MCLKKNDVNRKLNMKILPIIITFIAISFLMILVINKPLIIEAAETVPVSSPPFINTNQKKETKSKEADRVEIKEKKISFTERLSKKGAELRFDMYGKFKNGYLYKGHIEIFNTSNGRRIQRIIINRNFESGHSDWDIGSFEYNGHKVQLVDINFDGYLDLRTLTTEGATGNNWYSTYIYDPSSGKFKYHTELSRLSGVKADAQNKQIITYNRGGACDEYIEYYKIIKDKLVLAKVEWTEIDRRRDEEAGGFGCFKYTGIPRHKDMRIDSSKFMHNDKYQLYMRNRMKNIKEEPLYGSLDGRRRGAMGVPYDER